MRTRRFPKPARLLALLPLVALIWLAAVQYDRVRTVTFVIPPGTNRRLAAGEEVVDYPTELTLTIGVQDTLVIENQDNVVHTFGLFTILPHATLTQRFKTARIYESTCIFHQVGR
jgi:hypothetical protein